MKNFDKLNVENPESQWQRFNDRLLILKLKPFTYMMRYGWTTNFLIPNGDGSYETNVYGDCLAFVAELYFMDESEKAKVLRFQSIRKVAMSESYLSFLDWLNSVFEVFESQYGMGVEVGSGKLIPKIIVTGKESYEIQTKY